MTVPVGKKTSQTKRSRGRTRSDQPPVGLPGERRTRGGRSEKVNEPGVMGDLRIEAGPAFSPATRLRVRGLNVLMGTEKEKVSLTLDRQLVQEIREQFGGRALSTSINELLYASLAQQRLAQLVQEMEQESGPPAPEAYERVLAQWFAND